jgi:Zn-dependent peptidase ImmA (M78 family)
MSIRVSPVVKPALLRWARETAGLSVDEAARKLGIKPDYLAAWEEEDRFQRRLPTVAQLRRAGQVYKRPLAVFFLPEPPPEPAPLHDFRRLPTGRPPTPSPGLRLEMRRARRRRLVALDLLVDLGRPVPEQPPRARLDHDPEELAIRARTWLGITPQTQSGWRNAPEALAGWLRLFEARGILVFQTRHVSLDEMRGFSLNDLQLPVIVLNAKDAPLGRVFTLVHEFTHLMLSQGGLCDPLRVGRRVQTDDDRIEVFCNHVGGAILVPRAALVEHPLVAASPLRHDWTDSALRQLAHHFAVSEEVVLRRLLILGRTTGTFYERRRQQYLDRYRMLAEQRQEQEGFAPYHRLILRDNGREYTRLILEALDRERITSAEVSDYLGVQLKHLDDIAGAMEQAGRRG